MLSQIEMRAHLVAALEHDLIGPMEPEEMLRNSPSRWYLTGFLVPGGAPDEQRHDPTAMEELDNGLEGNSDDDRGEAAKPTTRPFLPSSFGFSALVPPTTRSLSVRASWGAYHRLDEDQTREALLHDDRPIRGDAELKFRLWKRTPCEPPELVIPVETGTHKIPEHPGVEVHIIARPAPQVPGIPEGTTAISVFLVNRNEPAEKKNADSQTLFQVRFAVSCAGFWPRTRLDATTDPDDRRNDLQYRKHKEWAVGHGVSTNALLVEEQATEISTCWMPTARVYRMAAEKVPGVELSMEKLATAEIDALKQSFSPLKQEYTAWMERQRTASSQLTPERRATALELLGRAEQALERIADGIATLEEHPLALKAFQLTNQAMGMAARKQRDEEPRWRLFQLAFLLLNLRGMVEPTHKDRSNVDLLFFPTGGGKTEAYLGVAAFAMLLRRLRHREARHQGAGVAVILRYTLRLLTLDQLGRAATLTAALELIRKKQPKELSARRFTVGLWVGRKATPNTLDDAATMLREYRKRPHDPSRAPPVPLMGCPWCNTPFSPESFTILKGSKKKLKALRVGCDNLDCEFCFANNEQGIPVVVIDEQLYRELPAFIIGTVDKFAALPWRGATGSLFGKVLAGDDEYFYGAHESQPKASRRLHGGLPPPDLIVQDELHLITGPLGTMVGLYETAIDELSTAPDGSRPKIIASTATARRASQQIQALYARSEVSLFPPQGLDDGDTFFAKTDTTEESSRQYLGVAAPGRSSKAVLARVYTTLLGASYKVWYGRAAGNDNDADTYMTLAGYFNSLRELGGAQRLVSEEVAPRVADLERRKPVGSVPSPWFRNRRIGFDVLELTSRQSTSNIRDAASQLRDFYSPKLGRRTDVLLASSMISVGVDIPRLGLMVVNGQPRTVAEYIQASSRVGRSTPGLVVTTYNLFKPRDRSHYERFTAFHDCFYRYVEASSVTPFSARAVERGLAGLTVALARHKEPGLADPPGARRIPDAEGLPDRVAEVIEKRVLAHRPVGSQRAAKQVGAKVRETFADLASIAKSLDGIAPLVYSSWEKQPGKESLLSTSVDPRNEKHDAFDTFRAPTSMRDVEPSVHIWVQRWIKQEKK